MLRWGMSIGPRLAGAARRRRGPKVEEDPSCHRALRGLTHLRRVPAEELLTLSAHAIRQRCRQVRKRCIVPPLRLFETDAVADYQSAEGPDGRPLAHLTTGVISQ